MQTPINTWSPIYKFGASFGFRLPLPVLPNIKQKSLAANLITHGPVSLSNCRIDLVFFPSVNIFQGFKLTCTGVDLVCWWQLNGEQNCAHLVSFSLGRAYVSRTKKLDVRHFFEQTTIRFPATIRSKILHQIYMHANC